MAQTPLDRAALIISECQQGIIDPASSMLPALAAQASERGIIDQIGALAESFRRAGKLVVYCNVAHRPDGLGLLPNSLLGAAARKHHRMVAGSADVAVPDAIAPQPTDVVSCRSTGVTAFYGTDLDAILRLERVETLVLAGVSTDVALPGLALEAVNRGYWVVLAEDCTAGTTAENHRFMVTKLLSVLARIETSEDLVSRLGACSLCPAGE